MNTAKTTTANARKMRNFRPRGCRPFSCALTEGTPSVAGVQNLLKFQDKTNSETLAVPDYLLPEARQIMKRGNGDKMLDFASLCIRFEVACAEWERGRAGK